MGFETYLDARKQFDEVSIPSVVIIAIVCNKWSGSDFSVGANIGLKISCHTCDHIKQSATGTESWVFSSKQMGD